MLSNVVSEFQEYHLLRPTTIRSAKTIVIWPQNQAISSTWFCGHCTNKNKDVAFEWSRIVTVT